MTQLQMKGRNIVQKALLGSTRGHRIHVLSMILLVCLAFLLLLNIHISNATTNIPETINSFPSQLAWQSQCADCPKSTPTIGDRGLRLDSNNQPHI